MTNRRSYSIEGLTAPQLRAINSAVADHYEHALAGDPCPTSLRVLQHVRDKIHAAMRRQDV